MSQEFKSSADVEVVGFDCSDCTITYLNSGSKSNISYHEEYESDLHIYSCAPG